MTISSYDTVAVVIDPEKELSRMFKDDLGVEIDPQALRIFIRWRWGRVRRLAHAIHGSPAEEP